MEMGNAVAASSAIVVARQPDFLGRDAAVRGSGRFGGADPVSGMPRAGLCLVGRLALLPFAAAILLILTVLGAVAMMFPGLWDDGDREAEHHADRF